MRLEDFKVGETYPAWSERVFGVPVPFKVTGVGRKLVHGKFHYPLAGWSRIVALHPDRFLG